MGKTMRIDAKESNQAIGNEKQSGKPAPLFKYEPDSKYTGKLWILAAIMLAICAILYVAGLILPSAPLTGLAMLLMFLSGITIFLMRQKMRKTALSLTEKEIDDIVENYKIDLINTFNGYDLDYEAKDILIAADNYRKTLEQENGSNHEIGEDEPLISIFKKMLSDLRDGRQKHRIEKRADKQHRKNDREYVKAMKKKEKSK